MFSEDIFDFNLPGNVDVGCIQDQELLNAQERALASNSITPLLKQELRYKIQSRRLTEGKDELNVSCSNTSTSHSHELTAEEIEKRGKRKEQNRQAAKRFRLKRKDETDAHLQEMELLQQKNTALHAKVKDLLQERSRLFSQLAEHLLTCSNPMIIPAHTPLC
ncbi:basic leucine zipper transcriptional factor ATF-like 3 [Haliotis rubra]|uniref:basic leucine zipper transcriptional factor ATF-like 3 n=1 Tax=Haliotis rubra TaxID=36100 RepID=UPI001EE5EF22|nr:basic leucine zipper transcriptional factor ATF-like 3 [Haliotis rubra]